MKVFTIESGQVSPGAMVQERTIAGGKVKIDIVLVGERGRGRKEAFLPVQGRVEEGKEGDRRIFHAVMGQTQNGRPKLIVADEDDDNETTLIVFRTTIGYRGGNAHTGDRSPEWTQEEPVFLPFPGEVLARGTVAQGGAGRMGSGSQLIAIVPKGMVFRTAYSGRLYGEPSAHYYLFDGQNILAVTWEERVATGIF